jgi:hypothetical protein
MSGSQIDWTSGQKYLCITPQTWAIKSKPKRLEAAKADLMKENHVADAKLLNDNRLNSAFYKLSENVRAQYLAERAKNSVKNAAAPPNGADAVRKRERAERREGSKSGIGREGNFPRAFFFFSLSGAPSQRRKATSKLPALWVLRDPLSQEVEAAKSPTPSMETWSGRSRWLASRMTTSRKTSTRTQSPCAERCCPRRRLTITTRKTC